MKINIFVSHQADHQMAAARALQSAFRKHRDLGEIFNSSDEAVSFDNPSDAICTWGWRKGGKLRQSGRDVLLMERAYLLDRFKYVSLAWNGLNGKGVGPLAPDSKRWQSVFAPHMKQWRTPGSGKRVIVMGQVPLDTALKGVNFVAWADSVITQLHGMGYETRYRPHPLAKNIRGGRLWVEQTGTLDEALEEAEFVVTYNSNSAVDAIMAGVPAVVYDRGSMAWSVASHRVTDQLVRPDRSEWGKQIAWRQWTIEEIESGVMWPALKKRLVEERKTLRLAPHMVRPINWNEKLYG